MGQLLRTVAWIGDARATLKGFPGAVQVKIGYALYRAQAGFMHTSAKPLKGFGPGTLEIVADEAGNTYRAVYTVKLAKKVYVLHCFQKKSKTGIATPKKEIELIGKRLKRAEEDSKRGGK